MTYSVAYAMPNDSYLSNINTEQSANEKIVTNQVVNVGNYDDLKKYENT